MTAKKTPKTAKRKPADTLPTRALLQPQELDFTTPIPSWVKTALLAFLFFLLFQFAWTGAGKISSIYRQYRQFQQWRQNILPPNPFNDDKNRRKSGGTLEKWIDENLPADGASEYAAVSEVFLNTADDIDGGRLRTTRAALAAVTRGLMGAATRKVWFGFCESLFVRAQEESCETPEELAALLRRIGTRIASRAPASDPLPLEEAPAEEAPQEKPKPSEILARGSGSGYYQYYPYWSYPFR